MIDIHHIELPCIAQNLCKVKQYNFIQRHKNCRAKGLRKNMFMRGLYITCDHIKKQVKPKNLHVECLFQMCSQGLLDAAGSPAPAEL